jgi:hypothetical protein
MYVRCAVMGLCALVLQSFSARALTVGNAGFPSAVNPKFSNMSPGRAIRETCLEQFSANKAHNANGGLHFIQKGGGYLTECNKRLQGHH